MDRWHWEIVDMSSLKKLEVKGPWSFGIWMEWFPPKSEVKGERIEVDQGQKRGFFALLGARITPWMTLKLLLFVSEFGMVIYHLGTLFK